LETDIAARLSDEKSGGRDFHAFERFLKLTDGGDFQLGQPITSANKGTRSALEAERLVYKPKTSANKAPRLALKPQRLDDGPKRLARKARRLAA
jgi:hypothetical protein